MIRPPLEFGPLAAHGIYPLRMQDLEASFVVRLAGAILHKEFRLRELVPVYNDVMRVFNVWHIVTARRQKKSSKNR